LQITDDNTISKSFFKSSITYQILLANLLPVFGIIFFNWDAYFIIGAYFLESIVIGLINVVKIYFTSRFAKVSDEYSGKAYFIIPFFIAHYGFFVFVQITILSGILSSAGSDFDYHSTHFFPNFIDFFSACFQHGGKFLLISLLLTHLYDLIIRFIRPKHYYTIVPSQQMFEPYMRIFVQQFLVILGSVAILVFNSGIALVILLVIFKTTADIIAFNPVLNKKFLSGKFKPSSY
jgi:hypothetical protein